MGRDPEEVTVNFNRGLETVRSPLSRRNSLEALTNVWLAPDDIGALQAMPGFTKVNSSEITGATFEALATAKSSAGARMNLIGYENGSEKRIVHMNPDGTTVNVLTEATSTAITVGEFMLAVLQDLIFFVNGTDQPPKSTISTSSPTISEAGLTRPDVTNASITVTGTLGDVKGIVRYYIAQISGTTESAMSAMIDEVDAASGLKVTVDLSHADFSGNTYRVYRTLADGVEPFLVAQVAGGASFTDNVADRALTSRPFAFGDQPPAALVSIVNYNDRLWALNASGELYWSDLRQPESWWDEADGNKAPVNEDDGDTGVVLVRDVVGLYAFKKDHIYRILGAVPADIQVLEFEPVTQQGRNLGTPSTHSIVGAHRALAFYWNKGIYLLQDGTVEYISADIEDDLSAIRSQDEEDGVYLGFFPKRRHLHVSVPLSAGTAPTHTYIYDLDASQWIGRRDVGFRGFLSTFDASGGEELWAAGAANGFIYKLEDGVTAAGTAISTVAQIPPFFAGNPSTIKEWLYVDIHYDPQASGTFSLVVEVDGKTAATQTYSISQVKASTAEDSIRVNLPEIGLGRQIRLQLTSSADQPQWKIYGLTYGFHRHKSLSR